MIRDGWFFTHPGSRGQKVTGSRIRIHNTATDRTYVLFQVESARLQLAALRRNNYKTGQDGVTL